MAINGMMARVSYAGSGGIVNGSKVLMTVAGCMVMIGLMISSRSERVQVFGHCMNARCDMVQFTSGLWALSQSVLRMMLWSPMVIT